MVRNLSCYLRSVEEEYAEREDGANDEDCNIRGVGDASNVVWFAVLCEAGQASEAHDAEQEEDRSKDNEHVVCYPIDNLLKAGSVLLNAHQSAC